MKPMIFFDCGANDGYSSVPIAEANPTARVFGFEPTPQLIDIIQGKIVGLANYTLVPVAVSNYTGRAEFNISGNLDWGCSSLLPLSDDWEQHWYGRTDMRVTETTMVDVIRLDSYIDLWAADPIPYISFLHIDTQGSDLKVLEGLGRYIEIVEGGVMEAATKPNVLYNGQNGVAESIEFLKQHGFLITNIQVNDPANNEVNIEFMRA